MNKQLFIGNLTKDVELKQIGDKSLGLISLAVNDKFSKDADPLFLSIQVWGKMANVCAEHLEKGSKIAIETFMKANNYEKDGKKIYSFDFIAVDGEIEFLSTKKQ